MKYTLLFTLIISCCVAMPIWEPLGPYGCSFRTLAIASSNEDIIFMVSDNSGEAAFQPPRIFKTTDGGNSWFETGVVSDSLQIYSLAVDPTNPDIIYAGSKQRVYKSTDAGANWIEHLLSQDSVLGVAVHPTTPSIVFAVGRMTIMQDSIRPAFFKSTDGGANWDSVSLDTILGWSYCLDLDPSDPDVIYVSGKHRHRMNSRPRIWKSTDGGSGFTEVYTDTMRAAVKAVSVHPTNSDILYAGRESMIIRSTDAGNSWSEEYDFGKTVLSLATSPADTDVVYAGTDSVVHKSTDAGDSWFETGSGIRGRNLYGLAVRSTDADLVYATTTRHNFDFSGFYKTTNGGTNWFESNLGISVSRIPCFELAPSTPTTIYISNYIISCYKTTNSGDDWTKLPYFACSYLVDELAVHNTDPDTVLCIEGSG